MPSVPRSRQSVGEAKLQYGGDRMGCTHFSVRESDFRDTCAMRAIRVSRQHATGVSAAYARALKPLPVTGSGEAKTDQTSPQSIYRGVPSEALSSRWRKGFCLVKAERNSGRAPQTPTREREILGRQRDTYTSSAVVFTPKHTQVLSRNESLFSRHL